MPLAKIHDLLAQQTQRQDTFLTSSGSSALIAALQISGLPRGSEILMPSICCPVVLFAIQLAGYKCTLADVSSATFNSELEHYKNAMSARTRAIVAVHGFGKPCAIDEIETFAKANDLLLIEDACLALGGNFQGRALGSFGDISVVSFGYDKPVTINYGGALMTNRDDLSTAARAYLSRNEFMQYTAEPGMTDDLYASLTRLPEYVQERISNVSAIQTTLTSKRITQPDTGENTAFWRYPVVFDGDRDALVAAAREQDLLFTMHYRTLASLMTEAECPNAQFISDHVLNIFVRPNTGRDDIMAKVEFLNSYA